MSEREQIAAEKQVSVRWPTIYLWAHGSPAAGTAAWAVVVRDLIAEDQFEVLYGLWREVVGDVEVAA